MRASVPAGGWGNFFFAVKIEGAGGFLVAGTFFLLYGGFVEAAFCVFGNRRGLRGVKLARGWSGRSRRLRKKNAREIFFVKDDLFSGGAFCFF